MTRRLWLASVMTLLTVTSIGAWPRGPQSATQGPSCDPAGQAANLNFTLKDMHGKSVSLSAYKGKVLLVDFWATWCATCKVGIPALVELQKQYSSRGLVVLGVSVEDTASRLKTFAKEFKMNYPVLVGAGRNDLMEAFGSPEAFPTLFVIGRDGKVCKAHVGLTAKEQVEQAIRDLL